MAIETLKITSLREMAGIVLALAALLAAPGTQANMRMPRVGATFVGAIPATAPLGAVVDLTLQIRATEDAVDVTVELLPQTGVEIVSGNLSWSGALAARQPVNLPLSVRFTASGEYGLGARVTIRMQSGFEVSGALLSIIASDGTASLSTDSHAVMKLRNARTPDDLRRLGIGSELPAPSNGGAANESGFFRSAAVAAATATVSGTVKYLDPEGHSHPVRLAYVQLRDGVSGAVLAETSTNIAGFYAAVTTANSVTVDVFSRDVDNSKVTVFPPGQPNLRYVLESPVTPLGNGPVTIDMTSNPVVRGTPGSPSNDSLNTRAFSVYDAMLTNWHQVSSFMSSDLQKAMTSFPDGLCVISCYSKSDQQIRIIREDAFDWDILGHKFFKFVADRASSRIIDSNPSGVYEGGSAIGRDDGTGHLRTRDEGMRFAWGEGLAAFMSLALQQSPGSFFPYPSNFLNIADRLYSDTENREFINQADTPAFSDGFASEDSVLGLLWDLFDSAQDTDGIVTDNYFGVPPVPPFTPQGIWDLVNYFLSCNPCDRVDRFWTAVVKGAGPTHSIVLKLADLFALNKIAPEITAPADNASVPGRVAPTFEWKPNGDRSASHNNNVFVLLFSRDDFQTVRFILVPTKGATSYTPSDAEWQALQSGGNPGDVYKWLVAAKREDDALTTVPEGWFWYSNQRRIIPRAYSATITWSPLGGDVDLRLANPSGTDISYDHPTATHNGATWGFLDRDCITRCAEENLSIASTPLPGTYRLYAHYYRDRDKGAATVTAEVYVGSTKVVDTTFTLAGTGAQHDILTFNVPASGPTKPEIIRNNQPSRGIEFGSLPEKSGDESWTVVPR